MCANPIGLVDKIRVVKTYPNMLVRFTLKTSQGKINCLVAKKELANQLLFFEDAQTEIACFGHINPKEQLVIEKMTIRNPSSFISAFAMAH